MGLPAQWSGVGLEQEEQDEPREGMVISEGEEELYKCTACLFVWGYMMCALGRVFKIQMCTFAFTGRHRECFLTTHLVPVKSVCSLPSSPSPSPFLHCLPSPVSLLYPSPPSWREPVPWLLQLWVALLRAQCESTEGSEGLDPHPGRSWPGRGRGGWLQGGEERKERED